jgi:hypothetical protein
MMQLADAPGWELVEPIIESNCSPDDNEAEDCAELGRNLAAVLAEQ